MSSPRAALLALVIVSLSAAAANAQGLSVDDLVRMSPAQLEQLYHNAPAVGVPPGKVRGTALREPGTRNAARRAAATRLIWQGKVFAQDGTTAINRFFGVRAVRGELYQAPSWLDGQPALILDYARTSHVYARYRDEIRQVAPGLYLGLMYDRNACPRPERTMFFVLESCP